MSQRTRSVYISEARELLGEKYVTEMISDQFLVTQANNAVNIIDQYNGGKWDWAIVNLEIPITVATNSVPFPSDYNCDLIVSYGGSGNQLTAQPLVYVAPANYTGLPNQFTIESGNIIFPEVSSGSIYLKYFKRTTPLTNNNVAYDSLPVDLEVAVINYMVGMGFKKKRLFASANEYMGIMSNNRPNQYPNSFYALLERYAKNHIMAHGKTLFNKRPNLAYV